MSDATGLTLIERDALQVFAEGWPWRASGRRFADLTGRADRTYRRVLLRAERKLGARSRIHAVALAAAQGLIKVDGAPNMPDPTAPERTPPDDTTREIPCPRWSLEETHPAHEWDAPVDGHSECPGWAAPVAPDDLTTVARWAEANGGPGSLIQAAARRLLAAAPVTADDGEERLTWLPTSRTSQTTPTCDATKTRHSITKASPSTAAPGSRCTAASAPAAGSAADMAIPDDPTAPVTAEDLRERYALAAAEWALMYPISSWALADGEKAVRLAKVWGEQIARYLTEYVRDEELERLRAELAEARELARKRGDHVELQSQALDKVLAERDALKAAVEEVRVDAERHLRETGTTADRWKLGVYAQAARTMRILNHVLAAPETTPVAPTGGED